MAMHTESESDTEGQKSSQPSTRPNSRQGASGGTSSNKGTSSEGAEKFVGRVRKTKKRRSVAELNESISESHAHFAFFARRS